MGDVLWKCYGTLPVSVPWTEDCLSRTQRNYLLHTDDPQGRLSIRALPGNTLPTSDLLITDLPKSSFQYSPATFQVWFLSKKLLWHGTAQQWTCASVFIMRRTYLDVRKYWDNVPCLILNLICEAIWCYYNGIKYMFMWSFSGNKSKMFYVQIL